MGDVKIMSNHTDKDKLPIVEPPQIELSAYELSYIDSFRHNWLKSDFHGRGCMLEGFAQELDFGKIGREATVMLLREIGSMMK